MEFLRKYGTGCTIEVPVIKVSTDDFAVGADWTPAAGDVKISKNGGAAANIATLPTALTMGNGATWQFVLSATEMQAARVAITVVDAATKAVKDQQINLLTFGNASAGIVFDVSTATPTVDATKLNGDATSAANIAKTTRAIARCTATTGASPTSIPTSACTPAGAVADQFKGRIITFDADTTTTALRGQSTDITASSNAATPTFTVTALTTAPAPDDTFSIT